MVAINPALGLITYVTLPVFYMLLKTFGKFIERIEIKATTEITNSNKKLAENFEKVSGIKLKNGILHEEENFQKQNERYIHLKKLTGGLRDISKSKLFTLFVGGVIALIFGVGGYISTREIIIPGTIVAFLLLIPFVFHSFKSLMHPNIGFKNITAEMASLEELLSLRSEIRSEPINSLEAIKSLKFENVSYYSERGNLESLNFEVKSGEKLGVIALDDYSSDLIFALITKIIRPKDGHISINNCDINKLNTFYLRDIVTGIPQEKTLFEDTIANNISYPLEFDEYKYNDALNRSGLKDFLSELENKDQTLLDKDFDLSDELMQRISFANAFYKDSKIIVMNEATAGMNVKSEEALLKEIFKLKNKIIILMSNKTYNIVNCDKVLIIENERVLEYGLVNELLQDRSSVLSKMVKKVKANRGAKVS
jgi:ABC-type multidrug transport system fused ATPase/permease subunit